MKVQESKEMYLETILVLTNLNKLVRSIDIANEMSFSKPSVSRAVSNLKKECLITVDEHGYITLTENGLQKAQKILDRHHLLQSLLEFIGIDKKTADEDACRIEHVISDTSFQIIKEFLQKEEQKK